MLGAYVRPPHLADDALGTLAARGATVVDLRCAAAFAAGHVPGTLSIPLNASFTTWAGWLLPYDRDVYLVADASGRDARARIDAAVRDLHSIGLDRVAGWFEAGAVLAYPSATRSLVAVPQTTPAELAPRLARGEVAVVDVRGQAEWEAGHLPGVPNVPVGYLADRLAELPRDRPLVLQCQSGARSMIAASVLQARGFTNVVDLAGGVTAWQAAAHPIERGAPTPELAGA